MKLEDIRVIGPRILVTEDEVTTGVEARAKEAGLHIVLDEKNRPKSTSGIVVKMGTDPLFVEWGLRVGARITFGPHAGEYQFIEGKRYRLLEYQEVKMILPEDEKGS